ncbi:hypothetical protein [Streptomyces sp. NRRL S-350]|uniref:hypothetical protein n=1 Tax=Streptomyces sp. NRRL S-350 TaxID=1463902 RepID=UPI0007C54202|nr:hypothetical protein [Streptomyces sp. NRRL S-350]
MSQMIGAITSTGFAAGSSLALIAGLRGSDRISLKRDTATGLGFVTGSLWIAAGSMWLDFANNVNEIPSSVFGDGGVGNVGPGGVVLCLGITALCFKWKKMIVPAVLGISMAVSAQAAGGLGGTAVNAIIKMSGKLG